MHNGAHRKYPKSETSVNKVMLCNLDLATAYIIIYILRYFYTHTHIKNYIYIYNIAHTNIFPYNL